MSESMGQNNLLVYPPPPAAMLPPPVPSDTTQRSSSNSSGSRKRKRAQTSSRQLTRTSSRSSNSTFSGSIREKVVELDHGGTCWHCGASPTDICHVIGKKDRDFHRLLQQGLITFETLGHVDNAIPLCPLCHRNFDDMLNPGFIFLPADLEYFIQYEKADQDRRREIGRCTGTIPARVSPTAESYRNHQIETGAIPGDACSGTYLRFTLRDYFPKLGQPPFVPGAGSFPGPEPWHGAPMAALRRAFLVLGSPFLQGIPKAIKHTLRTLLDLYSDEILDSDVAEGDANNSADESSGDEERQKDSTAEADLRSRHYPSRRQTHSVSTQQGPDASQARPTPSGADDGESNSLVSDPLSCAHEVIGAIRHIASSTPLTELHLVGHEDPQVQERWWWNPRLTSEDVIKLGERISKRGHMTAGNYIMSLTRTRMGP